MSQVVYRADGSIESINWCGGEASGGYCMKNTSSDPSFFLFLPATGGATYPYRILSLDSYFDSTLKKQVTGTPPSTIPSDALEFFRRVVPAAVYITDPKRYYALLDAYREGHRSAFSQLLTGALKVTAAVAPAVVAGRAVKKNNAQVGAIDRSLANPGLAASQRSVLEQRKTQLAERNQTIWSAVDPQLTRRAENLKNRIAEAKRAQSPFWPEVDGCFTVDTKQVSLQVRSTSRHERVSARRVFNTCDFAIRYQACLTAEAYEVERVQLCRNSGVAFTEAIVPPKSWATLEDSSSEVVQYFCAEGSVALTSKLLEMSSDDERDVWKRQRCAAAL
jgi:hypothetical protein